MESKGVVMQCAWCGNLLKIMQTPERFPMDRILSDTSPKLSKNVFCRRACKYQYLRDNYMHHPNLLLLQTTMDEEIGLSQPDPIKRCACFFKVRPTASKCPHEPKQTCVLCLRSFAWAWVSFDGVDTIFCTVQCMRRFLVKYQSLYGKYFQKMVDSIEDISQFQLRHDPCNIDIRCAEECRHGTITTEQFQTQFIVEKSGLNPKLYTVQNI